MGSLPGTYFPALHICQSLAGQPLGEATLNRTDTVLPSLDVHAGEETESQQVSGEAGRWGSRGSGGVASYLNRTHCSFTLSLASWGRHLNEDICVSEAEGGKGNGFSPCVVLGCKASHWIDFQEGPQGFRK